MTMGRFHIQYLVDSLVAVVDSLVAVVDNLVAGVDNLVAVADTLVAVMDNPVAVLGDIPLDHMVEELGPLLAKVKLYESIINCIKDANSNI